uniref:Strictosidine synthase conserved region domain-containing protein n=1 Tax=Panagrolaimus superbus TaxID=310955 RepID=A0A914YQ80_9BILA
MISFSKFLFPFFLLTFHYSVVFLNGTFNPIKSPEWPAPRDINFSSELTKTIKYFENEVWGIESFAINKETNLIYGSSKDGFILEIRLNANFTLEIIGRYVYGSQKVLKRRPLGVRFSRQNINELYFVDAYQGIFMFNIKNKRFTVVYTNKSMPYLNDFDFLQNGDLVLSQPSETHNDEYFHRIALENKPNGRLLLFDMKRKEFSVLVDELYTPNGVQVSEEDGNTIFFSEMMAYQIKRFDASKKPLKIEIVIDRLPGMPDNIRFDRNGETLIIPLAEERMNFGILNYPFIKHYMLLIYEMFLCDQRPNIGTFASVLFLNISNGEITQAWNDLTGKKNWWYNTSFAHQ